MRRTSRGDASYAAALARPEFRAIFAASAIQITGTVVSAVVLTVLLFERTRSPLLASLTFTLGFLPYVFAGTLLSGIVDRVPPRRLLTSCMLGSAGLTAALAWPRMPVAVLLALLVGTGTLGGMASATQGALVRSVVPEASYVPARSLIRIASQVAQVGGNPLGGLLLVAASPGGAFLISSAALVIAASLARFGLGQYPVTGAADGTALLRDSLRGVRHVFSHVPLRRLPIRHRDRHLPASALTLARACGRAPDAGHPGSRASGVLHVGWLASTRGAVNDPAHLRGYREGSCRDFRVPDRRMSYMSSAHRDGIRRAIADRERGRGKVRSTTTAVTMASVVTAGALALALPGSTHKTSTSTSASAGSSATGSTSTDSGSSSSNSGSSGSSSTSSGSSSSNSSNSSNSSSSGLSSGSSPTSSSGSSQATSGGS